MKRQCGFPLILVLSFILGCGTGKATPPLPVSSKPDMADVWAVHYGGLVKGYWATYPGVFRDSLNPLADIVAYFRDNIPCEKTMFATCTLPEGVTPYQVEYTWHLASALAGFMQIVDSISQVLESGYYTPSEESVETYFNTTSRGLLPQIFDHVDKLTELYESTPTRDAYKLTFTDGTLSLSDISVPFKDMVIDGASVNAMKGFAKFLRGLVELINSFEDGSATKRYILYSVFLNQPIEKQNNPWDCRYDSLLRTVICSEDRLTPSSPYYYPWARKTTTYSNSDYGRRYSVFGRPSNPEYFYASGVRFFGNDGMLPAFLKAYRLILSGSSHNGLIRYDGSSFTLHPIVATIVRSLKDFSLSSQNAAIVSDISSRLVADYSEGAPTDMAALILANLTPGAVAYLACTDGAGPGCTTASGAKSYYGISTGAIDDIRANVPKLNLKRFFDPDQSPLLKGDFYLDRFFPALDANDSLDGVVGNDFVNDDGVKWKMVQRYSGADCVLGSASDGGSCVKVYQVNPACSGCETVRAISPTALAATMVGADLSIFRNDFIPSSSNGDGSHTSVPLYFENSSANRVVDPDYYYFWPQAASPSLEDLSFYGVLDWSTTDPAIGYNAKLNATFTILRAFDEYREQH